MKFKQIFILNITLFLLVEWISAYFIGGVLGVVSWWGIMGGSIAGVIITLAILIVFIIKLIRRNKITRYLIIAFFLCVIMAFPFCWFLHIGNLAYPASIKATKPAVSIELPFDEAVKVGWGGNDIKTNQPHVVVPNERWAYDFIMNPHSIKSKNLNDYGIYNKEIIAPIKGKIVGAYDKEKDILPGSEDNETMIGNYIYIKIEETDTYLVLAHIKQGSILVKKGQVVEVGTPLARVGNSGSTSEPHLHIHHQRQNPVETSMFLTEGLPLYFHHINGKSMPVGGENGDIISPKGKSKS
ncbi:M23 family metallopeptidase [Bacillus sp. 03113]|uniref:M23 family metallopeptidase n=1 Tax=Bacillus sp. 03113 TaxID=2578211 RepID=UPI00114415FD|nr:M23 family metallopeptidase [Bacillus sp. 03113]